MLTVTAPTDTYFLPDDAPAVLARLSALLGSAKTRIRFSLYGATLPLLFDDLIGAYQRQVDVQGLFDHTQACGPAELAQLHRLTLAIPPANFRVGTSPQSHQILHAKCLIVDGLSVWSGSFNLSPSAEKQLNDVHVCEDLDLAAAYEAEIAELWTWITAHEEAYQGMLAAQPLAA